jgi:signal peptidase I
MHDLGASRPVPKPRKRWSRWLDMWLRSLGLAVLLFLVVRTFFIEAFQIPSGSMASTLLSGDFLFVNKAVYGAQIPGTGARLPAFSEPHRGDVVVFAYPKNPDISYVKRVIGVPGDTVEMRGGQVFVNSEALHEPYAQRLDRFRDVTDPDFLWQRPYLVGVTREQRWRYRPTRDTWGPLAVPTEKYFVLGDNRDNSSDSRYWGFVDGDAIKGRPLFIYFSYDRETDHPYPWVTDIRWERVGSVVR